MAYKALYRKYRPSTFEEVAGQQYIVTTLLNAVKTDRIAHAYLFCGPRGTGKTSIAKLFAKMVNCLDEDHRPCGKCENCVDIQNSSHPDIIEMDAATNNGVEEIREIIEKVKYAPMKSKYKVYIIDEVHMMTTQAFNALLKTLEEPPEYCIFILATTEPNKVLPTIVSRCQRFDFKKLAPQVITGQLSRVADKEGIHCDDDALKLIADLADGGMRDALSILDQCVAYSQDKISVEDVSLVYGVATVEEKMELFRLVEQKKASELSIKLSDIASKGIDIGRLTLDLINIAKEAVIYSYSKDETILTILKAQQANELLKMFNSSKLLKFVDYLIDTHSKFKNTVNGLTYLEVCLLKMIDLKEITSVVEVENVSRETLKKQEVVKPEPIKQTAKAVVKTNNKIESVTEDFDPKAIVKHISYTDEEIYNILTTCTKAIKEKDMASVRMIDISSLNEKEQMLVNYVRNSVIFASSNKDLILITETREVADEINRADNNNLLSETLVQFIGNKKQVYSITAEQKDYYTDYFRSRAATLKKQTINEQKVEETPKDELISKAESLFGSDGFDVVEG